MCINAVVRAMDDIRSAETERYYTSLHPHLTPAVACTQVGILTTSQLVSETNGWLRCASGQSTEQPTDTFDGVTE
jgi:hypothetical protein